MKHYAIYKGEEFLFEGTIIQCAKYLGVKVDTAYFYATPTHHKRNKKGKRIYLLED